MMTVSPAMVRVTRSGSRAKIRSGSIPFLQSGVIQMNDPEFFIDPSPGRLYRENGESGRKRGSGGSRAEIRAGLALAMPPQLLGLPELGCVRRAICNRSRGGGISDATAPHP